MSSFNYNERLYIHALYNSLERVYFNDIETPPTNPIHYSFTVRADGMHLRKWLKYRIKEIYREINKIRGRHGLTRVKHFATRQECLDGL